MNRRLFLNSALAGLVGATSCSRAPSPANRVNIGVMGLRGRGKRLCYDFGKLPDVNVSWICEVDASMVAPALQTLKELHRKPPTVTGDLRKMLDDKSVDAIVIAAPDHWHAPATILSCDAGKDVYVEKPASHNIREGRLMVEAARRNRRIVQLGTQARSRPGIMEGIEYIRSGKIGRVLMAKAWDVQRRDDIGHKPDGSIPPGVDFDTWTGPALLLPFNPNHFHYVWHWNWNYGTGDIGNDGIHQIDIARWALGVGAPASVTGVTGKLFFNDDQQTPDTMNVSFTYPGGKVMVFEMRIWSPYGMDGTENGVDVYGSEGMVQFDSGFKAFDAKAKLVAEARPRRDTHARNFIDCIRNRKSPNAEIEDGHISTLHAHLGNIVARVGRPVQFDARTETIVGDEEANRLLGRQYRDHWSTPKEVGRIVT